MDWDWKALAVQSILPITITLVINWVGAVGDSANKVELTLQDHDSRIVLLEGDQVIDTDIRGEVLTLKQSVNRLLNQEDLDSERLHSLELTVSSMLGILGSIEEDLGRDPSLDSIRTELEDLQKELDGLRVAKSASIVLLGSIEEKLGLLNGKLSIIEKEVFQ